MNGPHIQGNIIIDRYEIIDFIGEGGMQFVYGAYDKNLKRKVAIKTPKNDSAKKRFHRSAEVSSQINHPNVARTLDYFEASSRQYLVEELVEGQDLSRALLDVFSCIDPYLAAPVFHHLAKGLAASHHVNVVHRDIKPTNIMVTGGLNLTEIKITDFGIAKMADEELIEAAEGGESSFSTSATAVGALPYMAPEAINTPKEVGPPADIWSIGAMMFEILTGTKPFGAGLKAVGKILEGKMPEFPSFMTSNLQFKPLSDQLIDLVTECLHKNPSTRPTADMLVEKCETLCYPPICRYTGNVKNILHRSFGFINTNNEDVFFNLDSVYGEKISTGDRVCFSVFKGLPRDRAHPVVKLRKLSNK